MEVEPDSSDARHFGTGLVGPSPHHNPLYIFIHNTQVSHTYTHTTRMIS